MERKIAKRTRSALAASHQYEKGVWHPSWLNESRPHAKFKIGKKNENKKMSKQMVFWLLMVIFVLAVMESLASVYYFQRGNSEYSFAVGQLFHGLKKRMIKSGIIKPETTGSHVDDERFGWLNNKNVQFFSDYCGPTAQYTLGPNGERAIPKPIDPVGKILFVGGSFTFGHCVSDIESYPYILATEYWKKWEVQNIAVSGFGTHQAYMMLSDAIKSDRPPSVVIYGMIPNHIRRNYLSRTWLESIGSRKLPHFELMNEKLMFMGTVGLSSGIEDGPELRKKEFALTAAYLNAMQKICAENDILFVVLFLPPSSNYSPSVLNPIYKSQILTLDLGILEFEGISPKDQHPNPKDHRRIAIAIGNSFISEILQKSEGT